MKAGSVTVDLAAATGGNIGTTRADEARAIVHMISSVVDIESICVKTNSFRNFFDLVVYS